MAEPSPTTSRPSFCPTASTMCSRPRPIRIPRSTISPGAPSSRSLAARTDPAPTGAASPIAPRPLAIPAPASGRPSSPATSVPGRAGRARLPRLSPGRPTTARNPCGAESRWSDQDARVVRAVPGFQPVRLSSRQVAANPLVAQNRTYTRYEMRLNEPEYSTLAFNGWSRGENLPTRPTRRIFTPVRSRSRRRGAFSPTPTRPRSARAITWSRTPRSSMSPRRLPPGASSAAKSDVALVGLHIVIKTKYRPQGYGARSSTSTTCRPSARARRASPTPRTPRALFLFRPVQAGPRSLADVRRARHAARQPR